MKLLILEHLVCPSCRSELKLKIKSKTKNEINEGILICTKCNDKFKISRGIPRFVVDVTKDFVRTEMAFSEKWKTHHTNHHAKDWIDWQKKWFLDRFDWESIKLFNKFLKSKKFILDAGTGIGNSAKMLSVNNPSTVFALDASDSIDFAYKKYGKSSNIHFIQADIRQLPFKKSFFDYIFSDQVLHHTKNTSTSFKYLTKFLQKDGHISIYVYNKKAPVREALSKLKKKITIPRDIPLLGVKSGSYDVQRFIYWHFLKCFWDESDNFERSVGVNFDWYYPKFAYRHTPTEVKKWYRDLKIKITTFKEIESGISVTGQKK